MESLPVKLQDNCVIAEIGEYMLFCTESKNIVIHGMNSTAKLSHVSEHVC